MNTAVYWKRRFETTVPLTFVDVNVHYHKGDDYVGGRRRGYYARFDVVREDPPKKDHFTGLAYVTSTTVSSAGLLMFLASCSKKSDLVAKNAVELLEKNMKQHLEKIREKDGITVKEAGNGAEHKGRAVQDVA